MSNWVQVVVPLESVLGPAGIQFNLLRVLLSLFGVSLGSVFRCLEPPDEIKLGSS